MSERERERKRERQRQADTQTDRQTDLPQPQGGGPPDKQQTRRFGQDARNARVDTPGALPADYRVAALYGSANSPCLRNKTNKSSTPQGRER